MIIDSHVHIPTSDYDDKHLSFKESAPAIEYLRAAGTTAAVFNTWRGVLAATAEDLNAANAAALDLAKQYAGFLYPGAVVHPFFHRESLEWLKRFRDEGLLWVGEQLPRSKPDCSYADAPYMTIFEECAQHGHIVQLHCTKEIVEVARRFPQMPVVCSHIASEEDCRAMAALPNLWMDVSGQKGGLVLGGLELARDTFGAGRLLYGTDFSGYEPRCFMARMGVVFPSPEDREMVYSGNIARLLTTQRARPIV